MLDVMAAPVGRAAIYVPALSDGLGPIYTPNAKKISVKLDGSKGWIKLQKVEVGPQHIETDGSQVVLINRVDEHTIKAIRSKYEQLMEDSGGSYNRTVVTRLLDFVRGYSYDPASKTVEFARNSGFHADIWPVPVSEFLSKYVNHNKQTVALAPDHFSHMRLGFYTKVPVACDLAYIKGNIVCDFLGGISGSQKFREGAFLAVPRIADLPPSLIDVSDIDLSYLRPDGSSVLPAFGAQPDYPIYAASDFIRPTAALKSIVSTAGRAPIRHKAQPRNSGP